MYLAQREFPLCHFDAVWGANIGQMPIHWMLASRVSISFASVQIASKRSRKS